MKYPALAAIAAAATYAASLALPGPQSCDFPEELTTFKAIPSGEAMVVADLLRSAVRFNGGDSRLRVVRHERPTTADDWEQTEAEYSSSYDIISVGHRLGGEELYVGGLDISTCTPIIEKWTFPDAVGAITVEPVADPEPGGGFEAVLVQPPTYVPPSQRPVRGPVRTVLSSDSPAWLDVGIPRSLVADPEGRFLLIHSHANGALYRLDAGASDPVVEMASVPEPHPLATASAMGIYDHQTAGRVVVLLDQRHGVVASGSLVLVLKDAENDGVFEDASVMTQEAYVSFAGDAISDPVNLMD